MTCFCSIIPNDVLRRLSQDPDLPENLRSNFADTASVDAAVRQVREQARKLTSVTAGLVPAGFQLAAAPAVTVYTCDHSQTLPGTPVANPGTVGDPSITQAYVETTAVAAFYAQIFNRNSIDDAGMTLMSSVHFGSGYTNAQWNGAQMIYGDGDGVIFMDFTRGNDVIAHELTHGVTQHTAQLTYSNTESGGLNESMSDVFGSMFRQWRANQNVTAADWLIGKDIMGPAAISRGLLCLRDMANPNAAHCLSPQPTHYSQYAPGMDPHTSSGIPNLAFHGAAMAIGGQSWEKAGRIWYKALTGFGPSPNLKMKAFADRTRNAAANLFPGDTVVSSAVDNGWNKVGL